MSLTPIPRRFTNSTWIWAAVLISLFVWAQIPSYVWGWDLAIYENALTSLRAGHDPYLDAMVVQRAFHATLGMHTDAGHPFSYVYSPATLPFMRWIARFPFSLSAPLYWLVYSLCTFATLKTELTFARDETEASLFKVLAPVSMFFPGLLHHDTLLSGNVAFVLYGCAFASCWLGLKRNIWLPFYVSVVLASCFKAPMLSLLAIPVLSAPRQRLIAACTAGCGFALFAIQPLMWPQAFRHYLEAVDLQFLFNRDFGSSPAGVVANVFFGVAPYRLVSLLAYVTYAVPLTITLFWLSRLYLSKAISAKDWFPVMVVGVVLLNPRLMEYDLAPVALPMAFILWRLLAKNVSVRRGLLRSLVFLIAVNVVAILAWKPTACVLLVSTFCGGAFDLSQEAKQNAGNNSSEVQAHALSAS